MGAGEVHTCSFPFKTETLSLKGTVIEGPAGQLSLDLCPPNADCVGPLAVIEGDLPLGLPTNELLSIEFKLEDIAGFGCIASVAVRNMPSWAGQPNPVLADDRLVLAAADGGVGTEGLPFSIKKVGSGCELKGNLCGPTPNAEVYSLGFASPESEPVWDVLVPQGESADWPLSLGGSQVTFRARNQRAYQTGCTDDYWNYAWWAVDKGLIPGAP
jgi:hypothetical protein